jgi:hypothetical protein
MRFVVYFLQNEDAEEYEANGPIANQFTIITTPMETESKSQHCTKPNC